MITVLISVWAITAQQGGQGGGFGGGGFGGGGLGGGGGIGGQFQQEYNGTVQALESAIDNYLNGDETLNILTPGEYSEWPLTLKAGQVVIAEARSDAFDPALEVVDGLGEGNHKVLAANDDRYPGDQRPLLLWRCEKGGDYALRVRCFHDKSGGQFLIRTKIYDSVDPEQAVGSQPEIKEGETFLIRLPIKAGNAKQVLMEQPGKERPMSAYLSQAISPIGLPDIGLIARVDRAIRNAILAPVDGDYYFLAHALPSFGTKGHLALGVRDVPVTPLERQRAATEIQAKAGTPKLWSMKVKAGEFLEISTPDLEPHSGLAIAEEPDYAKWDLKKPETNPFFPHIKSKNQEPQSGPAYEELPIRARDPRYTAIAAKRDLVVLIASEGAGAKGEFTLKIRPAAREFESTSDVKSELRVGNTDYWAFEAKAGDVMDFKTLAGRFAEKAMVRDPDLNQVWAAGVGPDGAELTWNLIARKPGRYLVAISSIGDGGGGEYSLSRHGFPATEFSKGKPAMGQIQIGKTEVWKFTAVPEDPLLVHRYSSSRSFYMTVCDENGNPIQIPSTEVDGENSFGILKVFKPTTYLIVITPFAANANYRIELQSLPGYLGK